MSIFIPAVLAAIIAVVVLAIIVEVALRHYAGLGVDDDLRSYDEPTWRPASEPAEPAEPLAA